MPLISAWCTHLNNKFYLSCVLLEILKLVMEHSSLNSMKKEPLRWSGVDRTRHEPFIRKGSTGGWGELLSEEQAGLLQKRLDEMFSKKELEFLGEQYK